jgi:V-type H+-transporting ATPase subunit d
VRGYKAGLLTQAQYSALTQCETLEGMDNHNRTLDQTLRNIPDFRMQLSATDYGNFLANEPLPISTATIQEKATQIMVDQFQYLRSHAVYPLDKFMDYITFAAFPALVTIS